MSWKTLFWLSVAMTVCFGCSGCRWCGQDCNGGNWNGFEIGSKK